MSDVPDRRPYPTTRYHGGRAAPSGYEPTNLADILDRILDKGLVIAGDISISLAQVELITIKIRLLIASADKAKEMGIDWWTTDPALSSMAGGGDGDDEDQDAEKAALQARVAELEQKLAGLLTSRESVASRSEPINAGDLIALSQQRTSPPAPRGRPTEADDDDTEDTEDTDDAEADAADDSAAAADAIVGRVTVDARKAAEARGYHREPDDDADADGDADAQADADADGEPDAQAGAEGDADADGEPDAQAGAEGDANADGDGEPDAQVDGDADVEGDADDGGRNRGQGGEGGGREEG